MGASFINDQTDDVVNGIADAYNNDYSLTILDGDIIQAVGFTKTLVSEVKHEEVIVSESVVWTTNNSTIVSVTSGGVIHCLAIGSTTIRCAMANNADVYDEVTIYVTSTLTNNYVVKVTPEATSVYEGESQTYTCVLTNNGVATADTFGFVASGVPADNYRLYVVSGNSFRIENIEKYLTNDLTVVCTSGSHTKTLLVRLRGDF
jgi:hypothetical protein